MKHMSILHVFNEFLPPTQMWLSDLLGQLDEMDQEQYFFTKKQHPLTSKHDKLYVSKSSSFKSSFLTKLKSKFRPVNDSSLNSELDQVCKDIKPDLIHAHFADIACQVMDAKCIDTTPLIVSFYGWDYEMLPYTKPKFKAAYAKLFKLAHRIITEGPHGKQMLIEQGCQKEKIEVIPLGIKIEKPASKTRQAQGKLNMIQIASFREKKGQIYSLRALSKCIEKGYNNIKLTLIGDQVGPYANRVKTLIKDLQLERYVELKGFLNYQDLHKTLSKYDVFVQPSCYAKNKDCEGGAPTTLFHAMHQGLPIIASDHCDIPFVVKNEFNGLISKEKNVDQLAEHMIQFMEMTATQYQNFSENGQSQLKSFFDIEKNASLLKECYQSQLKLNA